MKRLVLIFGIVILALGGCGGSDDEGSTTSSVSEQTASVSDSDQMDSVAQEWADRFGAGDINGMCDLTDDVHYCKNLYVDNSYAKSMADLEVEKSDYIGNEGVVRFSNGDIVQMRKMNDEWVVFSFGGKQIYKVGYDPLAQ